MSERRWFLASFALAAILTALIGRDVLFRGRTFIPTDLLTSRPPWGGAHATDAFVQNRIHQDILEFHATHGFAAAQAAREGRLFLWNPDILCGVPSAGDPQLGTFYPPRWVLYRILPFAPAMDWFLLIHFFLAGPAMYALSRRWGAGGPAALVTSAVWMLCGSQMVWFKYGGGPVAALFLPLIASALHRAYAQRSLVWIQGAGALWAALFLGSHPQLSFLALVWTAIWGASHIRSHGWRWSLAAGLVFSIVAMGLSSVQLLPFLDSLAHSQKISMEEGLSYERPWRVPILLVTLFWQRALGSPLDRVDFTYPWTGANFFEFQGYMGLLALALAVHACKQHRILSFTGLATLVLAVFYPAWWLVTTIVPPLAVLVPHRLYLFAFCLSLLAGLGFEKLLKDPPGRRELAAWCALAGAIVGIGALGAAGRLSTWISLGSPAYAAFAVAGVSTLAAIRVLRSSTGPWIKGIVAVAAVMGDLLPGFLAYNAGHEMPPPEPAAISGLPREERSLVDWDSAYYRFYFRNYLMFYGRSTPVGYVSQYPRIYAEMADALGGKVFGRWVEFKPDNRRALRALNVRAVLAPGGLKTVESLPRAWLVGRAEVIPDREARLRRLADASFDPGVCALLEKPARLASDGVLGQVKHQGPDDYLAECDRPCLMVVSETYDAGWQCEVDGQPAPILRANHAMRAVHLEPGTHRVVFRYRPRTILYGAGLSVLTLFSIAASFAVRARRS